MKNKLLLFILLGLLLSEIKLYSQKKDIVETTLDATIYTSFFDIVKEKVKTYVNKSAINIVNQRESKTKLYSNFYINKNDYLKLDSLMKTWGYVSNKVVKTNNHILKIDKIDIEIKYLVQKKQSYNSEISKMTEKGDRYYKYWEEIRFIEKQIFSLQKKLKDYKINNTYYINITLYNESVDLTTSDLSWVNMPGASFDMLFVESPVSSISASQYMGFSLKYLFTRGKSYAILGALKESSDEVEDNDRYKELFILGFGQDFYSKHFGRGKNKFLNLYTGYNIGGVFATGENSKSKIFYLAPFLGIELFKNKYILLDTRAGYFVPFYKNRNLRGIMVNASFNFVF